MTYSAITGVLRDCDYIIALACHILEDITRSDIQVLDIHEIEKAIRQEFHSHTRKSASFFDCVNLAAAKHFGLKVASFDTFYPKALRVSVSAHSPR